MKQGFQCQSDRLINPLTVHLDIGDKGGLALVRTLSEGGIQLRSRIPTNIFWAKHFDAATRQWLGKEILISNGGYE